MEKEELMKTLELIDFLRKEKAYDQFLQEIDNMKTEEKIDSPEHFFLTLDKEKNSFYGPDNWKPVIDGWLKLKDVTARIKTFNDACNELGNNHPIVLAYDNWDEYCLPEQRDVTAFLKLRIICMALNEGWTPQFTREEIRWYPWFYFCTEENVNRLNEKGQKSFGYLDNKLYAGLGYSYSNDAPLYASAYVGSHLCLKTKELAEYCGKQFTDIWRDFYLK